MAGLPIVNAPSWMRAPAPGEERTARVRRDKGALATVCEEARCPNQGECWASGTATFLLMGDVCTRACRFCAVTSGRPAPLDPDEPRRLVDAVATLGLRDVVLTSVDRDDLEDGGASHLARCVAALKCMGVAVELLAPDFGGNVAAVHAIVDSGIDVFAHNVETVQRLTRCVRDARASFESSLAVLTAARARSPELLTKSGLMLGLGEDDDEVLDAMIALRDAGVSILTLGQYLRPTWRHAPVMRWVEPMIFDALADDARTLGFVVAAGPLVRSSYRAAELLKDARARSHAALEPAAPTPKVEEPAHWSRA